MDEREHSIRFVNSSYDTLFRIPDGGTVEVQLLGRKLISLGCMGASEERRERKVLSISCSCLLAGLPLSHPRRVWILFFVQISVSVIGCEKCFFIT